MRDIRHDTRSHARGSLGSGGLLVARCRAVEPRCARLLLAAHGYSQLLGAERIARCHAGGPRYARLLASLGREKHIALVSRGHGFKRLLAAARGYSQARVEQAPSRLAG
jgi:hypothetical protein